MKKALFRKFLCVLILAATLLSTVSYAGGAYDADLGGVDSRQSDLAAVETYALNFMRTAQNTSSLCISNTEQLFDLDGNTTGYYVTFINNGQKAGYVLLSLLTGDNDPVVEFAFEGAGLFDHISMTGNRTGTIKNNILNSPKLIYTGPDSFFIENSVGMLYSIYDEAYVSKTAVSRCYAEYRSESGVTINGFDSGGIINWDNSLINYCLRINSFGSGSDYFVLKDFSNGNVCAPTAATNVVWYWATKRWCVPAIYPVYNLPNDKYTRGTAIFDIMNTAMGTGYYWGTWDSWVLEGYRSYFNCRESSGGTWNCALLSTSATFADYQAAISSNCPVHLMLRSSSNPFAEGHDVFCLGYATGTNNYLVIMDGWNTNGRLVRFGYYSHMQGYKIWVNSNFV